MSSNSGIRGTPLKTSDDEAELGPDSQIIEEEAGLSPNNQIKPRTMVWRQLALGQCKTRPLIYSKSKIKNYKYRPMVCESGRM